MGKKNPVRRRFYVLKSATGVDRDAYLDLLDTQNNKCAICNKSKETFEKNLCVDHCHTSNNVRGLLCLKCNMGLGYFNDDENLLQQAINYLNNNLSYKNIKHKI